MFYVRCKGPMEAMQRDETATGAGGAPVTPRGALAAALLLLLAT